MLRLRRIISASVWGVTDDIFRAAGINFVVVSGRIGPVYWSIHLVMSDCRLPWLDVQSICMSRSGDIVHEQRRGDVPGIRATRPPAAVARRC
jgi:hypothetical protein